jgi:ferredoxin
MTPLMLTLVALSHLILAAHALRRGNWALCAALTALPLTLLTRRGSARLVSAAVLTTAAGLWAGTGVDFALQRFFWGEPWLRMVCIIGGVFAISLASGLWLMGRQARMLFFRRREEEWPQATAFLLTVALLAMVRAKAVVPVLLVDRYLPGSGWLVVFALGIYAAWLTGRFTAPDTGPRDHRKLRPRIWALFSALFFVQLALGLGGFTDMLMTGKLHLPVPALIIAGPIFRGGGLFMPILFASTVLLVGPAWCSHLCYIGAWDDAASRLGPKPPHALSRRWILGGRLATLVLVCGGALILRLLDVPGTTATWLAAGFGLVGVAAMIFVSRRLGAMAHCTAFCPIGLVGNVLSKLVPWRIRIRLDHCTRCGACARACRYSALTALAIEAGRPGLPCTLCGDCVGACPHDAMQYRFPGLTPTAARTTFLTLVVVLHSVFLGVARL